MAEIPKTIAPTSEDFPFDLNVFKPRLQDIEIFDRGSENPQHRFSIKTADEKFCVISEDEKFVSEFMDGNRTIDEIAAVFMEQKGRIALTMIRSFIFKLWKAGILSDAASTATEMQEDKQSNTFKIPLPGFDILAKILSPVLGLILLNPISLLALLGAGGYGSYILFQTYSNPAGSKSLFTFNGDTSIGLVIMTATLVSAALLSFIFKLMLHSMYSIKVKQSGLKWAQIVPGFFVDAPGVTTLKANSRFYLKTVGMIVIFGLAGTLLILDKHLSLAPQTSLLFFQISFYLIIYLFFQCCPLLNNDLYTACADYLDEPYLRKASVSFLSRHLKSFFSPSEDEQGDSVIYMMYAAGVLLWITCTAQLLLSTLSQNSSVLSGLFSSGKSFSSWLILILILLPVLSGFIASMIMIYKFIIKLVTSQAVFKNTRNLIILSAGLIFCFVFFFRLMSDKNRVFALGVITFIALTLSIKHSLLLTRLLKKSEEQPQYFTLPFLCSSFALYFIGQNFISENDNLIFVSLILLSITSLLFSSMSIKIDWGEFIKNRRDSMSISLTIVLLIALILFISKHIQAIAVTDITFSGTDSLNDSYVIRNRTTCLYAFIACGLSLILNVPSIVYKRGTQSFAPFFCIIFSIHLSFYFVILVTLKKLTPEVVESMAAVSLLMAVGICTYKSAVTGQHKNISPYPFGNESEKDSLCTAFKYITQNILFSIKSDLGEARSENICRHFNQHAAKAGWNWTLENPLCKDAEINVLGEQYNAAFQHFHKLVISKCGAEYTSSLIKDIDDHLHAGARDIIYSRVPSFTNFNSEKRHINLTFDKKKEIIDKIILFQDVKKEELPSLIQCLQSVTYETGDLIIKQHDDGDRLFILASGSAQVEIEDLAGNTKVVSYLTGNEFFGEIALFKDIPRTASVRATAECTLLYLKRKDFDNFLGLNPERKEKIIATLEYLRVIKAVPLFKGIDSSIINLFASKMSKESFNKGEDIIKQGDDGDKFYIILEGKVKVHVVRDDNKDHDVATLGRGEYFGEIALFKNIPRTATVTAETESTLLISLQKADFMKAINTQSALESNLQNVTHRRIVEMMH